jgi:hypothetical protein
VGRLGGGPRLWRVVALFFLVFTAYDLVQTGVCAEELLGLPTGFFATADCPDTCATAAAVEAIDMAPDHSRDSHPAESGCVPEDCFCCCSHLRVANAYVFIPIESNAAPHRSRRIFMIRGPSDTPYRPPRTI